LAALSEEPVANIGIVAMLATRPAFSEISFDPVRRDLTSSIDALLMSLDPKGKRVFFASDDAAPAVPMAFNRILLESIERA
jgi:hypothetical protein